MNQRLIVFAKRPAPGYAKTRLGISIGSVPAAGVYARILYRYLLDLAAAHLPGVSIELALASPEDVPFFADAFPEFHVRAQIDGDLGERLAAAFAAAFAEGNQAVVITGSDIPELDSRTVRTAFDALATTSLVIGPATDGGYYLIGMRAPGVSLFEGIAWSTDRVLAQTEALALAQGLMATRLGELDDIDTVTDMMQWQQDLLKSHRRMPRRQHHDL